jgi:hypothetical protein
MSELWGGEWEKVRCRREGRDSASRNEFTSSVVDALFVCEPMVRMDLTPQRSSIVEKDLLVFLKVRKSFLRLRRTLGSVMGLWKGDVICEIAGRKKVRGFDRVR